MNTIINVECVDQELIITNSPTLASGGICENVVSFKFCSKWDGFSKTAVFYQNEKNVYYALIDSNNTCEIPYEVTLNEGTLHFGVFGVNGDTRRTSKVDKIRIHKGAWNKDMHPSDPTPDIYTQILSALNEANALLHSFLNGTSTTPVGNAKTLEGHGASYFATKETVDSIQTTSRATLSQAGWYRVAEYEADNPAAIKGSRGQSCALVIKRSYTDMNNESHLILYSITYNRVEIKSVMSQVNVAGLTKTRVTYDGQKAYLEVYYSLNVQNNMSYTVLFPQDYSYCWKTIDAVATAETVDGVTVTTTYDIPSNATPVTDLDVGYLSKAIVWSRLWTSVLSVGTGVYRIGSAEIPYITDLPSGVSKNCVLWLLVFKDTDENSYLLRQPSSNTTWVGSQYGSKLSWSNPLATTADLANYLDKRTGGDISGSIRLLTSDASIIQHELRNSVRQVYQLVNGGGYYYLHDGTNGGHIITSTPDGTNTFNGVASGNLPLDGGGTVKKNNYDIIEVENTLNNAAYIKHKGTQGVCGYLGFNSVNKPCFKNAEQTANYLLVHEGNYGDYNNFYKGLSVTNANGMEGGEIKFACPQTDHSFDGMITQDIFQNIMRIFATHDGKTKLFNIDFASMKEGGNEALHTGNSARVTITSGKDDVPDTMDGLWAY